MEKIYDITIFGATGYTGEMVLNETVRVVNTKRHLKIAIAGRSKDKLNDTLQKCFDYLGFDWIKSIPMLVVSLEDRESVKEMAKQSKVILNCVGPFRFYGEPIVQACIDNHADQLDICGEPEYLESMQLKYSGLAKEKGVYVVGACAFESAIADLGVLYTQKKFAGTLNEVEGYLKRESDEFYPIHDGTWKSLIHSLSGHQELKQLRRQLYPNPITKPEPKQIVRGPIFRAPESNLWALPMPSSDLSVVYRSQRYFVENGKQERMIQFRPYICLPSFFSALFLLIGSLLLMLCVHIPGMRSLLEKYPEFFSGGIVSRQGATRKQLENGKFTCTFIGKGWSDHIQGSPNSGIITKIESPDIGYITCSICIVEAAVTLLEERDKMPDNGGVLTPGSAFRYTSYLERMEKRLEFSVVESKKTK